jgi:hypothetical protein
MPLKSGKTRREMSRKARTSRASSHSNKDHQDEEENSNSIADKDKKESAAETLEGAIKTVVKIFPTSMQNENGYYIADVRVSVEDDKKPFSFVNTLDNELENMVDHIAQLAKASQFPIQKELRQDTGGRIDESEYDINNFMPHDTTEILILPTKHAIVEKRGKGKPKEKNKGVEGENGRDETEDMPIVTGGEKKRSNLRGRNSIRFQNRRGRERTRKEKRRKNI